MLVYIEFMYDINTTFLKILHVENKKTGDVFPVQATKASRGSRGIAPLDFNIDAVCSRVLSFADRPHCRSGPFKSKCKVHPCRGTEALYRPYDP